MAWPLSPVPFRASTDPLAKNGPLRTAASSRNRAFLHAPLSQANFVSLCLSYGVQECYRRLIVRFFSIGFLDFFDAFVFFEATFGLRTRARLTELGLSSPSAANSSTPISEPVAATLAAFAMSLTAWPIRSPSETLFFFAITSPNSKRCFIDHYYDWSNGFKRAVEGVAAGVAPPCFQRPRSLEADK
jgi:hypothetical protein